MHLPEQYNLFFENVARKKYESDYDMLESAANPIYIVQQYFFALHQFFSFYFILSMFC